MKLPKFAAEIIEWIEILLTAFIIAMFINNVIIANSQVPTGSMETTINAGDRVIGSRLAYTFGEPERGDIAIFEFGWKCRRCRRATGELPAPDNCPNCGQSLRNFEMVYYVKRVIGLPGDKIEIVAEGSCKQDEIVSEARDFIGISEETRDKEIVTAAVYVNGERISEDYLREPMLYTGDMTFEVPQGHYFMMGDNRNGSLDARYWSNPYIESKKMMAKVLLRYWPLNKLGTVK